MLRELISQSANLLGQGHREKVQCVMVGAEFGNRTELRLIAFSFFMEPGLEVKDGKGPSPMFCLNGILLYQLLLEA